MATPSAEQSHRSSGGLRIRLSGFSATAVGLIAVIFLSEAVIGILLLAINPKYPASQLGAGVGVTGLAISIYGAAKMPGQPLGGWLADRMEPRAVLIAGMLLSLPTIVLMERFHSVWLYLTMWALFGLSVSVVWPTVYAIVGHRFRADLQGRLLALVSMGQIAGTVSGVGAGAFLIDYVSYTSAFILGILLTVLALAAALFVVRGGDVARRNAAAALPGELATGFGSIRAILSLSVVMLIFIIMLLSIAVAMLTPDLQPYSERILNLKYSTFVLLLVPPAVVAAVLLVPAGYLADRYGRNLPIIAGIVIFPASLFVMTLTRTPILASLVASAAAAGYVLMLPALSASLLDVSHNRNRGLVTGVSTSIQAIGLVIGPAIGGFLVDGYGPLAPFRVSVAIMVATALLVLLYARRTKSLYSQRLQMSGSTQKS